MQGDERELKAGSGRVRWDDEVEERDEGGRWRGDDWGPNGITMKPGVCFVIPVWFLKQDKKNYLCGSINSNKHVFDGAPGGNPHEHGENMQTPHRKDPGQPVFESRTFLL